MSSQERRRRYRHVDAALVRATAFPHVLGRSFWPAPDEADVERWCAWLSEVWADSAVAEAVTIASPVLASQVAAVCHGKRPAAGQVRRMALALARYLVRMRGRSTPFALFAGVAPARFGPDASALWTGQRHVRARADAVWLTDVITQLEASAALRRRLSLVINDLAFIRGERLIVPWQPHSGGSTRRTTTAVSVRHNRAVQAVIQVAARPIPSSDLTEKLSAEMSDVPVSAIEGVIAELITHGVLITCLRPPSTCADRLGHVIDALNSVNASAVDEVAPLVQELTTIRAELNAASSPTGSPGWQAVANRMQALSTADTQPLMLGLRLSCTLTLPPQVAADAVQAAGVLLRLTPNPGGHPAWADYHSSFLARYGPGALVPVHQLVDGTTGLGFPAHYAEPGHAAARAGISRRDERLLALAQQAALDGVQEVVVDDVLLDALAPGDAGEVRQAPHMALCAEVHAPTMATLAEGDFTLMVTGTGRTGVTLAGRFVDLLPEEDRQRITGLYEQLPVGVDGAIPAQLSFPPRHPHAENVTCSPRLLRGLLTVAEHRGEPGRLPIQDLAVTADRHQLYLVSLSRRRVVEPSPTNAAAPHNMPPLARFLFELPHARRAAVSGFSWGLAECLPFLPRLRCGRTVLAPARWRIPVGALPGPDAPWPAWRSAMDAVRERLRLPDNVQVGESDRVLRLRLDEPMDLTVLREHLDKAGPDAAVAEAPSATDYGWFGGRAHEIVVPLASTARPAPAPAVVNMAGPLPLVGRENGVLPGSRVLFAKVYGDPEVFDTILTRRLPELWSAWPEPPTWWFVRYQDPRPHLRLRLHLASTQDYGTAAVRVGAWATDLRCRGLAGDLVLDTYQPETPRYGSGPALMAAEALFAADSAAVLAQLTALAAARDVHPYALTAASMVDLMSALAGGVPAGMRWLIDHARTAPAPAPDRAIVRQAIRLADPDDQSALLAIPGGAQIAAAWRARRAAATAYVQRLATDAPHMRRAPAFGSLLHMHHVRAHGIDPAAEHLCDRATRSVALSWAARHRTTEEATR